MKLDQNSQDPNPLTWLADQVRNQTTEGVSLLVGVALLFAGRRMFWLFVGGIGFVCGMVLTSEYFKSDDEWLVLAVALSLGIIGAFLSVFLQKIAVRIAGLLAGAYVPFILATELGYEENAWIAAIVGGLAGFFLVAALFDWSLVVLSALTGSILISQVIPAVPVVRVVVFVILFAAGVAVQARSLMRWRATRKQKAAEA